MSEVGNNSDERGNGKGKPKPKGRVSDLNTAMAARLTARTPNYTAEDSEFAMNGNGKRKRVSIHQDS